MNARGGSTHGCPRHAVLPIAVISVLCAAVLLDLNGRVGLTYDTFWHLFTTRYVLWEPFFEAVRRHAHPPLYFLVLKASAAVLGNHLLAYRAVSFIATLGSIAVLAHLLHRTTVNPWLPPVAAAAFAFSWSTAEVTLEARGYALAVFLSLAALEPFTTLAADGFGGDRLRLGRRLLFASLVTVAFLVHYVAGFVFAACCAAPLVVAAADRDYARRLLAGSSRRWLSNALTFGLPAAAIAASYGHIREWSHGRLNHVPDFMFDPSRETFPEFVGRASGALAGLFSPFDWTRASQPVERLVAIFAVLYSRSVCLPPAPSGSPSSASSSSACSRPGGSPPPPRSRRASPRTPASRRPTSAFTRTTCMRSSRSGAPSRVVVRETAATRPLDAFRVMVDAKCR